MSKSSSFSFSARLSAALLAGVAMAHTGATAAHAQSGLASSARSFDIKPQPLVDAMQQFSHATGIQVAYTASVGSGVSSGGASGSFSPAEALSHLLIGTGLTYRYTGANAVTLEPAPQSAEGSIQLGPVRVAGAGETGGTLIGTSVSDPTITEGTKSYAAAYGSVGSKAASSLRETPQSISIITRQRIEDQALSTIQDVMTQTTGITLYQGTLVNSRYMSRGFEITSARKDGGAAMTVPSGLDTDMAFYDHVEVMRGSDGLFGGEGEPSGTINLVRKKPTAKPQFIGEIHAGSWNNYRAEADASGPLAFNGALRGRVVAAVQHSDFFQRGADRDRALAYGVIEADLSSDTLLRAGLSYDHIRTSTVGYGLPRSVTGEDLYIDRRSYVAGKDDGEKGSRWEAFARLEHKLGADWKLTVDATFSRYTGIRTSYFFNGAVDPATGGGYSGSWGRYYSDERQGSVDVNLAGKFNAFGRRHDVIVGGTWQDFPTEQDGYLIKGDPNNVVSNIYTFDANSFTLPQNTFHAAHFPKAGRSNEGLYGSLKLNAADGLNVILGGRLSWYSYSWKYINYDESGAETDRSSQTLKESAIATPYAAITYDVGRNWTAYASYAKTYKSQSSSLSGPLPGTPLAPVKGVTYEAGIKGELADGRLTLSAALYRIDRNGQAVRDSSYPPTSGVAGTNCCYLAQGLVRSQGVETELSGEILPGWQMTVGYTFNDNKNRSTNIAYSALTPRHLFKLFTSYRLPEGLPPLTVGGGITAQSSSSVYDEAYVRDANGNLSGSTISATFTQKAYALVNLFTSYEINRHLTLSANLNNGLDKRYYSTIGYLTYGNWYGAPRNFLVTLRAKY